MTDRPQVIDTVTWKGALVALPDTFELLHYHQVELSEVVNRRTLHHAIHR